MDPKAHRRGKITAAYIIQTRINGAHDVIVSRLGRSEADQSGWRPASARETRIKAIPTLDNTLGQVAIIVYARSPLP